MTNIKTAEASKRYGPSKRWFEKGRLYGYGPPHLQIGAKLVFYDTDICDKWFAGCQRRSTSEAVPEPPNAQPASPTPQRRRRKVKVQPQQVEAHDRR